MRVSHVIYNIDRYDRILVSMVLEFTIKAYAYSITIYRVEKL